MDLLYSRCRLSVGQWEAELMGPPEALDSLADELEKAPNHHVLSFEGGGVGQNQTSARRLKIRLEGTTLWIEGDSSARDIVLATMRGVAQESREVRRGAIPRHSHIEYLGEGDEWRAEGSFPLVVTADWPD